MGIRVIGLLACGLLIPFAGAGGPTEGVREIEVKGDERAAPGAAGRPAVITSAEELSKAFPDRAVQERLAKAVNFRTERLLVFAWSGLAGDTVTFTVRDKGACPKDRTAVRQVTFRHQGGAVEGPRPHLRLFVLPKGEVVTWPAICRK